MVLKGRSENDLEQGSCCLYTLFGCTMGKCEYLGFAVDVLYTSRLLRLLPLGCSLSQVRLLVLYCEWCFYKEHMFHI